MKVLLDTCVLSELHRSDGNPRVRAIIETYPDADLCISVLTLGELIKGVSLLAPGKKKEALQRWIEGLEHNYANRILPIASETGRIWGEITAQASRRGVTVPAVDGLIAATALRHGLHLMTRNSTDFAETGVLLINPWE